jgi:hypothetical protein
MAPEVLFTVLYNTARPVDAIRQLHELTPAVLEGYCRHRVKFADYPGIIPEDNSSVLGLYVTGLTEANMQKLDYFEGSEYERTMVKVKLRRGSGDELKIEENKAYSYVFLYPHRLEKGEWNFEQFHKEKMSRWTRADYIFEGVSLISN